MASIRPRAALVVALVLAGCGPHEKASSPKQAVAKPVVRPMYVPTGMKDQQYAIRLGDRLRRRLGGSTVRSSESPPLSPFQTVHGNGQQTFLAHRMKGEAAADPLRHPAKHSPKAPTRED